MRSKKWRLLVTMVAAVLLLAPVASRQLTAIRVAEGDDLQAAIDAAKPGDTILLSPAAEFVGAFVLPPRADAGQGVITIKTDASGLPRAGTRTGPQYAGTLAMIRSDSVLPALRTSPGAHHWRIENVEFGPGKSGEGAIIALGSGEHDQHDLGDVPHDIVFDRVYIHGDPQRGQKRGIALNSASTQILNSYIGDIKAVGVEGQAIAGWNGPGPFLIENNHLEAAGENVMFGGADPAIDSLVPADITIRHNYIGRPVSWKAPVVAPPMELHVELAPDGGGTLQPGAYIYRVVAERAVAGSTAVSAAGMPAKIAVPGGAVAVRWEPVAGADAYRVCRSGPGGDMWWRVTGTSFLDKGEAGFAGASPSRGSVWTVKNLLELKNARAVAIDGNIFEHHWPQAQAGFAIVLTPRNQGGRAPWSRVEDVRFTNNVVRHVSAGINVSGTDDEKPSGRAQNITIENNLFLDVGGEPWGGPGDFVQIGNGPAQVRIERNTAVQTGKALFVYGSRHGREVPGFVFRGNIVRHNRYGVFGTEAGVGKVALDKYFPGGVFEDNVFAGGDGSEYPPGNRFAAADALDGAVVADATGYRLKDPSSFKGSGADLGVLRTTAQDVLATPPRNRD